MAATSGARRLAALVATAVVLAVAQAQECRTYEDFVDGSLGLCAGVVDYRYFAANASMTQTEMELDAFASLTGGDSTLALLLKLLPTSCGSALKQTVCMAKFPKCQTVPAFFLDTDAEVATDYASSYPITEGDCDTASLFWDESTSVCGVALPVFPCRESCEKLSLVSPNEPSSVFGVTVAGDCPLVSGMFYPSMLSAITGGSEDSAVLLEYSAMLAQCGGSFNATCLQTPYTLNALKALNLSPSCEATVMVSATLTLDIFPEDEQSGLAAVIDAQIGKAEAANGADNCAPNGSGATLSCADVAAVYGCTTPAADAAELEKTFDVLPESSVCAKVVGYESTTAPGYDDNQDLTLIHSLASRDQLMQLVTGASETEASACLSSGKTDTYPRAFYVPSTVGMGPLSSRMESTVAEPDLGTWDAESCPVEWEGTPKFANYPASSPLCTYAGYSAYNSRDCLLLRINYSVGIFPKWASVRCQAAFREYACGQGLMKPQYKSLCLVPDEFGGCDATDLASARANNQIPLTYALPRFVSRDVCTRYATECASILPSLPAAAQPVCDGVLNETACPNGEDSFWGCLNSFNGLESFPETTQTFANPASLGSLGDYVAMINDPTSVSLDAGAFNGAVINPLPSMQSDVSEPTISKALYKDSMTDAELAELQGEFCECPSPLVVPDSPTAETINSASCCALPCLGTMLTRDDMQTFGTVQFVLSLMGVLMSAFMIATWAIFQEKSKQYMTFWLSICSFNISVAMLAMVSTKDFNPTDNLCLDNSRPNTLKNSGFTLAVFQALWLVFFAIALCAWWLCQALDLYRKLVWGARSTDANRRQYHAFAWSVPIISTSVIAGLRELGFQPPTPWALITEESGTIVEWVGFYMFIACCFVAGSIMMGRVIYTIMRHVNQSSHLNQGTTASARRAKRLAMYRTPMLFVLLFIFVWLNIFFFRFTNFFMEDTYTEQATAWVTCLLTNFANGITDPATNPAADISMLIDAPGDQVGCGFTQPGGLRRGSLWLTFCVIMSQSILIFIVFGMHKRNYQLWAAKLGLRDELARATVDTTDHSFSKGSKSKETNTRQMASFQMTPSSFGSRNNSSFYSVAAPNAMPPSPPATPPPGMGGPQAPTPYDFRI
ncbi:Frizzled-2 [Hondaea fermentalgiana]|uniref:Frizzled-2 n=1 Tax=Hondaea fermentalgiana TaxID=2315210 RepID=A0A2R5G0V9_9STRA|nr:Frizzled-2 [Hondaea fermentalgiana]|eukprot:GBG24640.1 Frizzled-2 [Hondaea fermentalgiana]